MACRGIALGLPRDASARRGSPGQLPWQTAERWPAAGSTASAAADPTPRHGKLHGKKHIPRHATAVFTAFYGKAHASTHSHHRKHRCKLGGHDHGKASVKTELTVGIYVRLPTYIFLVSATCIFHRLSPYHHRCCCKIRNIQDIYFFC